MAACLIVEISGIFSGLFAGIVVGALARLLAGGSRPVGCLLTIIIGLLGAALGLALGAWLDWGFWLTFLAQIVIAALIVIPFARIRGWD
ncbi:MAG: GlsB/YeaQ/YmgE family stress response membrane protein [Candidatus Nanopelagicales bacterium]